MNANEMDTFSSSLVDAFPRLLIIQPYYCSNQNEAKPITKYGYNFLLPQSTRELQARSLNNPIESGWKPP